MKSKRIYINVASEAKAAASTGCTAIEQIFTDCRSLSGRERLRMIKLGDGSEAFVGDVINLAKNNLMLLPRGLDVEQAQADLATREYLLKVAVQLQTLTMRIQHTAMMLGSDVMSAALSMYKSMQNNGEEAGIDEELRAIGKRFAVKKKNAAKQEEAAPVPAPVAAQPEPDAAMSKVPVTTAPERSRGVPHTKDTEDTTRDLIHEVSHKGTKDTKGCSMSASLRIDAGNPERAADIQRGPFASPEVPAALSRPKPFHFESGSDSLPSLVTSVSLV